MERRNWTCVHDGPSAPPALATVLLTHNWQWREWVEAGRPEPDHLFVTVLWPLCSLLSVPGPAALGPISWGSTAPPAPRRPIWWSQVQKLCTAGRVWGVPGVLPASIWKPFSFSVRVSIDGVGLAPAFRSASEGPEWAVVCGLIPPAICPTAGVATRVKTQWGGEKEVQPSQYHLIFLSNLKGKEASPYLHFKFKICI